MMTNPDIPNAELTGAISEILQKSRSLLRKPLSLGARDVGNIVATPVLEALGWDAHDPAQVRQSDTAPEMTLISDGKPVITLSLIKAHAPLPDTAKMTDSSSAPWILMTNRVDWALFNQGNLSAPFKVASSASAAGRKKAAEMLAMINRDAFSRDQLSQAWMSQAIDGDVLSVLVSHLDGSPALIESMQAGLEARGIKIDRDELTAALARIDIAIEGNAATVTPAAATASESAPAPKAEKPAEKSAAKTQGGRRGRPKGSTSKKSASKPAATAAAPEKVVETKSKASSTKKPQKAKPSAKVTLPKTPEEIGWPNAATHVLHRKKTIAFMQYDPKSSESTLLPGSIIVAEIGKSLNKQMIEAREAALKNGDIETFGQGMLKVTKPIKLHAPRAAATFAAATLVKDLSAWRTREDAPLSEELQAEPATS